MILPIRLINSLNQINSLKTTFRWISSINKFTERTHNCGQLSDNDIGKSVQLFGWVQSTRFDNKVIALRDSYGSIQCILAQPELSRSFKKINIHNESIVKITGTVRLRPKGHEDANSSTGSIEVLADHLEIINKATKDLPIFTKDDHSTKTWNTRLKHRHLDLRSAEMQHALRFRSFVCQILRSKLYELNFVECETPTLYKRTPGGANEFIVPTKEPSKFYSLTQSPQQLKQLLMIGGLDRYFQICRCYRDEQTRSDRQPEFTQLDIELSFTNQELVMKLVDEIVFDLMCKISSDEEIRDFLTESFDEGRSIKRMTYSEAFRNYGTDKPDTRFAWKISEVNGKELEIRVPVAIDSPRLKEFLREEAESRGVDVELICLSDNDNHGMKYTILRSSDNSDLSRTVLGRLRLAIADHLHSSGQRVYENDFGFLWVTEFPLFILDKDGKLEPNHHPFTAPTKATENFLKEDPLKVIGQHYDLVLNGQEIAGGSIRIHDAQLQRQIFTDSLGLKEDTFEYFIEALKTGCPPHGGIAFGLDRLVAILMNKKSIRDVIAFPKSSTGRDLLSECPHELDANIKSLYHIK